jgi:3-oxoacyl-[acyl-carrier-protein] synthase-1
MISAIGSTVSGACENLLNARTGIGKIRYLPTRFKDEFLLGEVKYSDAELAERVKKNLSGLTRTSLLGMIAALEALNDAGIDIHDGYRTGLISSTTVAGMCTTEKYYKMMVEKGEHLDAIDTHDCGDNTEHIADLLGVKDFVSTISTACSSAANAIMLGARLIKHGKLDRAIVGGTDAMSKFTFNGFNTLMILDREWCRPFDEGRKGLNLGEAAAFVVLESEAALSGRKKQPLARLAGYANANDAYHQTASSPEGTGASLAIREAIKMSGLDTTAIDYINMHGTGTPNNDLSESKATVSVFGEQVPRFSSTKSFTGHTLAAAAAVEAVISILSIRENKIFPNLNFRKAIPEFQLTPVTQVTAAKVDTVLSNSFGFGGNCSSLVFTRN